MLSEYERQVLAALEAEFADASSAPSVRGADVVRALKVAAAFVGAVVAAILAASVTLGIMTAAMVA